MPGSEADVETGNRMQGLRDRLRPLGRVVIAFSGGVDSTLLTAVAREELGAGVLAVLGRSVLYPAAEAAAAAALAARLGVRLCVLDLDPLGIEAVAWNRPDRCYHCKRALFERIRELAREEGIEHLLDGTNADDAADHRPGRRALAEMGVLSPLREAGLTKPEIRAESRRLGLPTADQPSLACLATRFPANVRLTPERLRVVDRAEGALRALGFREVRVRAHGGAARVELGAEDLERAVEASWRPRVAEAVRAAGFAYCAVDLGGYRTGSMNAPAAPAGEGGA